MPSQKSFAIHILQKLLTSGDHLSTYWDIRCYTRPSPHTLILLSKVFNLIINLFKILSVKKGYIFYLWCPTKS